MVEQTIVYQGIVVAESPLLKRERKAKYGSVPGLDDEELADPDELERQVIRQELGPVLLLASRGSRGGFRPDVDEDGIVVGAFGSVDLDRLQPEFDKTRYKADKLREQLRDVLIMLSIVKDRLPKAKYLVLKYLRMGIIELEHIVNEDMLALARLWLRARRLRRKISELQKASSRRKQRQLEAWLES